MVCQVQNNFILLLDGFYRPFLSTPFYRLFFCSDKQSAVRSGSADSAMTGSSHPCSRQIRKIFGMPLPARSPISIRLIWKSQSWLSPLWSSTGICALSKIVFLISHIIPYSSIRMQWIFQIQQIRSALKRFCFGPTEKHFSNAQPEQSPDLRDWGFCPNKQIASG